MQDKTKEGAPLTGGPVDRNVRLETTEKEMEQQMLPCPFCGQAVDLEDRDTLYPDGTLWRYSEEHGCRTYHGAAEQQPGDGWCYGMHCTGCSAEVHGDTKEEAVSAWNMRAPNM